MKKDVIYIDIEDDITAIIGKVKDAGSKIVALVPPKRIGVLQSAVNLKLLQKSATTDGKRIVLITNDHSLTALAAGLKLPVAKNLQSRPEVPELDAPETPDEEIINGEDMPVGELAAAAAGGTEAAKEAAESSASAAESISSQVDLRTMNSPKPAPKAAGGANKLLKVPNFDVFRKRLFLIGAAVIVLVIFLYWALAIAPHATVTITAKTTSVSIDQTLNLNPALPQSDVNTLKFKPNPQQLKKSVSADVTATGTKDIGNKATGTVTLTNSFDSDGKVVPAGTQMTSANGMKFVSTAAANVPGATVAGGVIQPGKTQVAVQASDIGPDYNIAAQNFSVTGYDSLAAAGSAMAGGDKQTVTIVSQADVDRASTQLAQQDANSAKATLKKQFTSDYIVLDESFTSAQGAPSVAPAIGEQAKQAKLTVETTYTMFGLARTEVNQMLNNALKSALDTKPNQSIFNNGSNNIVFSNFQRYDASAFTIRLSTNGNIGPKVNIDDLTKQIEGKRFGEIQAVVNQIPNVNNVDIKFSPFWVSSAPSDPKKIDIKFSISQ